MLDGKPVLYSYWRSSCSWRVRIALNLKGIDYEYKAVNLLSHKDVNALEFIAANPVKKVPCLVLNGTALTESLAIIEYLEEMYPDKNSLLPKEPLKRGQARALALQIVAGVQPLQNLRVIKYLNTEETGKGVKWAAHWLVDGLRDFESMVSKTAGKYALGDVLTIADLCIPSIVYNAKRFGVDISQFPTLSRLDESLAVIPEFASAHPDRQPDANVNA